jgi:hypothetical protein
MSLCLKDLPFGANVTEYASLRQFEAKPVHLPLLFNPFHVGIMQRPCHFFYGEDENLPHVQGK